MNKSIITKSLFQVVTVLLMLLFGAVTQLTLADDQVSAEGISIKNPGADLWRTVRQRDVSLPGATQSRSVDAGVLINPRGEQWASFRKQTLINIAIYAIAGIVVILALFYLIRGRVNIEGGLSGRMVFRFTDFERILHWVLAIVFLFLAFTGLILLLGRSLLIPVLGHELFALLASSSKEGHNLFGPIFMVSLLLMLVVFMKRNIYAKGDLMWLLKGGGMIGKSHVTGGFFNMGEKSWYWLVILVGLVISITGLILVSPVFGQSRWIMELSHLVHAFGAILLIAVSIGHMYLGSIGTEGTSEGMKNGYVDIKWAEAHHDRWAHECHVKDLVISAEEYAALKGEAPAQLGETRS